MKGVRRNKVHTSGQQVKERDLLHCRIWSSWAGGHQKPYHAKQHDHKPCGDFPPGRPGALASLQVKYGYLFGHQVSLLSLGCKAMSRPSPDKALLADSRQQAHAPLAMRTALRCSETLTDRSNQRRAVTQPEAGVGGKGNEELLMCV